MRKSRSALRRVSRVERRIRATLFAGSSLIVLIVLVFLFILNINQPEDLRRVFGGYMAALFVVSAAALGVFFFKGAVFKITGEINEGFITAIILAILLVAQIAFAFASFAYRQMRNSFEAFDAALTLYNRVDWDAGSARLNAELGTLPPNIDFVYIKTRNGESVYLYGSLRSVKTDYSPLERYVFPFKDKEIGMHISEAYNTQRTRRVLIDLSTVIITGLFFGFEMIMLVMRYIRRRVDMAARDADTASGRTVDAPLPNAGFVYIRQLAFLFYFASRMAAAFIPVLAARLAGGAEGGSTAGGIAASIPQSAETLLTCAAIFITSELIIRTGWKVPFLAGLAFVVGGTALSGMAASLPVFIAARAVVGLGYGFCWMTLRNLALLGRSTEERNYGFALLNAGLYAGMNCGSVMGSILAEIIGYANVFFIAAALTALCACVIIGLENGKIKRDKPDAPKTAAAKTAGNSGIGTLISFLILLIAPACIAGSYTGYFLPLYASELGYGTADVGRAQLLYGVIIIYLAPKLSVFIRKRLGGGIKMSVLYNLLLAAALVITGIFGGFGAALIAVLIIALGDGFGFGAQNNYFLAIPCMSRLPESRALSILSFLKKLAEMAGPLTFAAVMGLSAAARPPFGVLLMGVLFAAFALFALWTTRPKRS